MLQCTLWCLSCCYSLANISSLRWWPYPLYIPLWDDSIVWVFIVFKWTLYLCLPTVSDSIRTALPKGKEGGCFTCTVTSTNIKVEFPLVLISNSLAHLQNWWRQPLSITPSPTSVSQKQMGQSNTSLLVTNPVFSVCIGAQQSSCACLKVCGEMCIRNMWSKVFLSVHSRPCVCLLAKNWTR